MIVCIVESFELFVCEKHINVPGQVYMYFISKSEMSQEARDKVSSISKCKVNNKVPILPLKLCIGIQLMNHT